MTLSPKKIGKNALLVFVGEGVVGMFADYRFGKADEACLV